jgi:hypothetical protein
VIVHVQDEVLAHDRQADQGNVSVRFDAHLFGSKKDRRCETQGRHDTRVVKLRQKIFLGRAFFRFEGEG